MKCGCISGSGAKTGSAPDAAPRAAPHPGNARGWGFSIWDIVVGGGETKFVGKVAQPPSTGLSPPELRLLTICTVGESSTWDG